MHENEKLNLNLRAVTPDDEPFLFQVYVSTRIEELEGLGWDDDQKQAFIRMQFLVRERTHPQTDDRIILLNGQPIGRMMVDRNEAAIRLRDIAVLTEHRNAGVGSSLIQDLLKEAAASGKLVQLHVLASSPAVRLYKRLGFRQTGDDGAYWEMEWS